MRLLSLTILTSLLTPLAPAFAQTPSSSAGIPVTVSKGDMKINSLLQFWGLNDSTNANLNYRIRRAEVKFSGTVADNTRYMVMIDPAKSIQTTTAGAVDPTRDNKVLQDLMVGIMLTPELELLVGQFKTPTTAEGLESSSELLLPERSMVARAYGDRREPGVMLAYKTAAFKASLMSANGQAPNVNDTNNSKDLHARIDLNLADGWKLGAFTTAGDSGYQSKARWGVNTRLNFARLLVGFEGVRSNDFNANASGYAADLGYKFSDSFSSVVRYDGIQTSALTSTALTFGMNYLIARNNSRIQAAYSVLSNVNGNNGSYEMRSGSEGSLFVLSFLAAI